MLRDLLDYIKHAGVFIVAFLVIYLLNPFNLGYLAGYLLIFLLILKKDFILHSIDKEFVVLSMFSFTYSIFYLTNPDQGVQNIFIYAVFPPAFYLVGKFLSFKAMSHVQLYFLLFLIGAVYSLTGLLSVLINLAEGGFSQIDRSIPIIWSGSLEKATAMGAYFTFNMCIPALLIINSSKIKFYVKVLMGLLFILSLLCVFRLGSRTQLVISFLTIALSIAYIFPKQAPVQNLRLFLLMLGGILFIYFFAPINLDADYFSVLGERLQDSDNAGSAGGRSRRWLLSIENLFEKPLGWSLEEFGYSHNLWLDVARRCTVIAFFILIIFSIRSLLVVKRTISKDKNNLFLNSIVVAYTLAIFLMLFVEPIIEGIYPFFLIYCLFIGIVKAIYTRDNSPDPSYGISKQ